MINIKFIKDAKINGAILIEGLPGVGLVGPMTVSYIIDKIGMEYIGYIESEEFPPLVSIHAGIPMPPVRLYYSHEKQIVALFSEFAIPMHIVNQLAERIYGMFKANNMQSIICIGGIPANEEAGEDTVYAIGSTKESVKDASKYGLSLITEGVSTGVGAVLLFKASVENVPDINILIPVNPAIINPRYAETAIKSINKILSLDIDISELEKEVKEVDTKIRSLIKKSNDTQDAHKKAVNPEGPSMYG